jgi:hypothetical protein
MLLITGSVVGTLWVATLLVSDASWWVITLFWVVSGSVLALWTQREARRETRHMSDLARRLESAAERNEAEVIDVRAERFVEFQEVEDEGACYAFDLGDDVIAFVTGQRFYPGSQFPSLDFSLVYPLAVDGSSVDELIEKRGAAARPARIIPHSIKLQLAIPEHLTVVRGNLDRIEEMLATDRD